MPDHVQVRRPLRALWDLNLSPITFDFATFLVIAECMRQVEGRSHIDLVIRTDGFRQHTPRDRTMPENEKRWRVKSIILDTCELLPTIGKLTVSREEIGGPWDWPADFTKAFYASKHIKWLHERGADPLVYRAPPFAVERLPLTGPYVTLTLRTSRHAEDRNVDLATWYKFYKYLRRAGHVVIVVPDQEDILGSRKCMKFDWQIYDPAAFDMRLRLALYERAVMNVCSANGVLECARHSHAPYLLMDMTRGGAFDSAFYMRMARIEIGQQFVWQKPSQRVVSADSTYENLP